MFVVLWVYCVLVVYIGVRNDFNIVYHNIFSHINVTCSKTDGQS